MLVDVPNDLLVEVLSRVGSSSHNDLLMAKLCCKDFLGATESNHVYENVSLEKFPMIVAWVRSENLLIFFESCKNNGNPEALFRHGMMEYFSLRNIEDGLNYLRRATEKGHTEARYVYGILLICDGGPASIQGFNLLTVSNEPKSFEINIRETRKRIRAMVSSLWVNTRIRDGRNMRLCSHERQISIIRNKWLGSEYIADDLGCESCKWDREVDYFLQHCTTSIAL